MYKKIFYNTATQTLGKVITASCTLLVTILIGKALGEAGYGEFTKVFVFVGYFYTLTDFGLNTVYVKIAHEENEVSLLKNLLGLRLIIGVTLALGAILASFFLPYNPASQTGFSPLVKLGIIIASFTIITQALITTANSYFQKSLRYDLATVAAVFGSLVFLLGTFFVSTKNLGLIPYISIYVFSGIATVILAFFLIFKKTRSFISPTFTQEPIAKLLSQSWPVGLALILNIIYFRIDVFILSNFRPAADVGVYGLAFQFFEASLAIPIFFSNALYPALLKIYKDEFKSFKTQVNHWLKILTGVSVLLTLALFIVAVMIPFVYNGQFQGSTQVLQILAAGVPFFFLTALLWHVLIIFGKQKTLIYIYLLGAIFNLLANLAFIPTYGYLAAAVTTVVSEAVIFALLALAYIKYYNSNPLTLDLKH